MPKLIRFRYNRKAAEEAYRKGLPLPESESVEVLGDAELDEYDVNEVAKIFYRGMEKTERSDAV